MCADYTEHMIYDGFSDERKKWTAADLGNIKMESLRRCEPFSCSSSAWRRMFCSWCRCFWAVLVVGGE